MIVQNHDIAGLVRRIRRFKYEAYKSNSAGLMFTTEKDLERFESYLLALEAYFNWMVDQPMQDLPESHPTDIDLGESEKFELPENEALADLIHQLDALEQEIGLSQSARMHTSIMEPDEIRFREITLKISNFLNDYVRNVQPLDTPESSPKRTMTGKGRRSNK
jgi:hypothetical protein